VGVVLAAVLMLGLVLVADKGMRSSLIEIAGLASQTPTATLTATFTPTPTPTLTPTPSPTPIPTLASYEIGLAVAYFAIPDDGSVSVEEADTLVDQINARLASELASFSDTVGLTLGYLGPADVGRIQGTDGGEREADANIIAERHDADVVLYGAITSGAGGLLEVQPEFYVSPDTFTDALEMAGAHRLGRAISVSGPLEAIRNALKINRPLSARTTAMVHIFAGLTYYAVEDFEDALGEFEAAADDPDWGPAEGREVLHVLLGNAQLKLASVAAQTNNVAQAREKLPLAEAEYRAAADLAPDYARAYTGLAAAAYLTWNVGLIDSGVSDIEPLEQALDYLELAHDARDQPRDTAVETRPVFARLQVDYALWYYHTELPPDRLAAIYQDFEDTAAQILEIYGDGRVRALQPIASETYALLGLVSYANYQCADAIGQYQQALDLSQSPRRRMFFYVWQAECYVEQGQNSRAAANYAEAIAIARALGDVPEEQVNRYETRLAELRGS
jgi:tetratricopeptide (TPR) repeat protein